MNRKDSRRFGMPNKLSKSPERNTFQRQSYLKRKVEEGKDEFDPDIAAMLDFMDSTAKQQLEREQQPEFRKNNMEYDLRSTEWILEKVRASEVYAQNLYAAMCNNDFQRVDVENTAENLVDVLKDGLPTWSCSWRYAGGIVADMREDGDYIDWYCSGIRDNREMDDDQFQQLTKEQQERYIITKDFVGESVVTDEIQEDLLKLGWKVILDDNVDI